MKALTPPLPREEANWIAGSNLHCPKIKSNNQHSFELGMISQKKKHPFFWALPKGAGSFHIHRKTMKELGTLALLGIRERPNLAQNLVTHWN